MKKQIQEHINFIQNTLEKEGAGFDWKALSNFNRTEISFFQHERLIHLLITFFFVFMFIGVVVLELILLNTGESVTFLINGLSLINAISLVVLIFYILHYFFLENSVQKLYRLDNEIVKRSEKIIV